MRPTQLDWLLAFLRQRPLDRLRLMKGLFLLWHRAQDNPPPGFFNFTPYIYGPCSFELYGTLDEAEGLGLLSRAPQTRINQARYFLTPRGSAYAADSWGKIPAEFRGPIENIVAEVDQQSFHALLTTVYAEAPEFATATIVTTARPTV